MISKYLIQVYTHNNSPVFITEIDFKNDDTCIYKFIKSSCTVEGLYISFWLTPDNKIITCTDHMDFVRYVLGEDATDTPAIYKKIFNKGYVTGTFEFQKPEAPSRKNGNIFYSPKTIINHQYSVLEMIAVQAGVCLYAADNKLIARDYGDKDIEDVGLSSAYFQLKYQPPDIEASLY